jgi:hypothetical protein
LFHPGYLKVENIVKTKTFTVSCGMESRIFIHTEEERPGRFSREIPELKKKANGSAVYGVEHAA